MLTSQTSERMFGTRLMTLEERQAHGAAAIEEGVGTPPVYTSGGAGTTRPPGAPAILRIS